MTTNTPLSSDLEVEAQRYISAVAYRLGFTMESLPDYVQERIRRCGEHGFSVSQAYYSTKDWLDA